MSPSSSSSSSSPPRPSPTPCGSLPYSTRSSALRPRLRVVCQKMPALPKSPRTHVRNNHQPCPSLSSSLASPWKWMTAVVLAAFVLSTCLPDWLAPTSSALASPVPNPDPKPFAFPLPVPVPQAQQPPPAAPAPQRPPAPPAQPPPAQQRPPAQQQPPAAQRPPAAPGTQPAPPARNAPAQPARPPAQPTRAATAPRATGTLRPTASARASVARPTQRKTIIQTKLGPLAKEDIDAAVNDPSKFSFTKPVIVGMAVGGGFMVVLLFVFGAAITRSSRR